MKSRIKIFYAVNARIPTEKAHGIQIMKTCEALADNGAEVTLVVPARTNSIKENPYDYYGVKNNFKIKKIPVLNIPFSGSSLSFLITSFSFAVSCYFFFLFKKDYILYARGEIFLLLTKLPVKNIFWETHIKTDNFNIYRKSIKKANGIIVVNKFFKNELFEHYGTPEEKILLAPDGVDVDKFNIKTSKDEARKKLGLPFDKKIILSSTSFLPWKGTDIFLKSAKLFPKDFLILLFKNGEKEYWERFILEKEKAGANNILIIEKQSYEKMPLYLKSADVLVLSGTNTSEVSKHYTSPLKMFEYMASQRPVLVADVPSFREILNDDFSTFYSPDDVADFAYKVKFIINNYQMCEKKAIMAFDRSFDFTWAKRAEKMILFIRQTSK